MKKSLFIYFFLFLTLISIYLTVTKTKQTTLKYDGFFPELTIDDLIDKSDVIVLGEIQKVFPSKWNGPNGITKAEDATPEEVMRFGGLFTDSSLSINQILKSNIKSPIRIRSFIGETKKVRLVSDSEISFELGKKYLLFLAEDFSRSSKADPGAYISVGAFQGVYEIINGRAVSRDDEWDLEELLAYIQNRLAESNDSQGTPLPEGAATPGP